jgi:hypothetical protein
MVFRSDTQEIRHILMPHSVHAIIIYKSKLFLFESVHNNILTLWVHYFDSDTFNFSFVTSLWTGLRVLEGCQLLTTDLDITINNLIIKIGVTVSTLLMYR